MSGYSNTFPLNKKKAYTQGFYYPPSLQRFNAFTSKGTYSQGTLVDY